jgi:hypothetical protein
MPDLIALLLQHRPPALRGASLPEALTVAERTPTRLRALWREWQAHPHRVKAARPTLAFAVIGQARADELIVPSQEAQWLGELLVYWAVGDAVGRTHARRSFRPPLDRVVSNLNQQNVYG